MEPRRISIDDLKSRMDSGERIVLVDSRSAGAWGESDVKIPSAIRVPPDEAERHLEEIPRGATVVTYCT